MTGALGNFLDGFETYSSGTESEAFLLSGIYAELLSGGTSESVEAPAWGARTGLQSLKVQSTTFSGGAGARYVLDDSYDELMFSFAYSCDHLPTTNVVTCPIQFRDDTNVTITSVVITSTGQIVLTAGGPETAVIASSAGPVVRAQTWHWFEGYIKASTGEMVLYVDDEAVAIIDATGLAFFSALPVAQVILCRQRGGASGTGGNISYMDDVWLRILETPGTPVFVGDIAIATLYPNADTLDAGWTAFPRKKLGVGILDTRAQDNSAVSAAQSTDFDIGASDFTFECFVRFTDLPDVDYSVIGGKWNETGNARSYQLIKCGPGFNSGALIWRISTNGTAGAVVNVINWPWLPETDTWYYLTVERVSGETTLYIDGIAKGLPVADANTYATVSTAFGIHGEMQASNVVKADTGLQGFGDEMRITIGAYRYDGDFTPPTAPFPTTVGGDPLFANVALLAQWDNGIVDSSLHGRTLTARTGALQNTPDDGEFAFQVLDTVPPRDDTFIQAEFRRAENELTFATNPTNNQAVVIGATTYTYKTVLPATPDTVFIGANAEASMVNIVAAINGDAGAGSLYGAGTVANADAFAEKRPQAVLDAYAIIAGVAGNGIATTTTVTSAAWSNGATMDGGADIPDPSAFDLQRLSFDATQVFAAAIMTRGFKSAAGSATITAIFVGPQGGELAGFDAPMPTNPTYRQDVFLEDPDGGPLTPSTIASAKIKLNRTE